MKVDIVPTHRVVLWGSTKAVQYASREDRLLLCAEEIEWKEVLRFAERLAEAFKRLFAGAAAAMATSGLQEGSAAHD